MPAKKVEMIPITKHIMTEILLDNGQRISHWLGNGNNIAIIDASETADL